MVETQLSKLRGISDTLVRRAYCILEVFHLSQRPKTGIPGPFGAKNRYTLKSSKKCTPRSLSLVQSVLDLFVAG